MVLLAAHPNGRTIEQIIDAFGWNDDDERKAARRVHTAITSLRKVLRDATGDTDRREPFIIQETNPEPDPVSTYRLDPEMFDVDLWRMLNALRAADQADNDTTRLQALTNAARAYTGEFGQGIDLPWVAELAAGYRSMELDTLNRIVEITEFDQPDLALAA